MLAQELYDQIELQERKYMRRSMLLTLLILFTTSAGLLVYDLVRASLPPPQEEAYELLGSIDFGDYSNGSKRVNNFQPPVEDPVEESQPQESDPEPVQPQEAEPTPAPPAEQTPTPTPQVTQTEPQEVATPDPPVEETKPDPTPPQTVTPPRETQPTETTNDNQSNTTTTQPSNTSQPTTNTTSSSSGSNHGTANSGTGNSGTPDVKTLDPNGLFSFGQGTGGLQGRGALALGYPTYQAQEEGVLEFTFRIEPNGSVSYVKASPTTKLQLKQAGIAAIRKWRFTAQPGAKAQMVKVKITFKLK